MVAALMLGCLPGLGWADLFLELEGSDSPQPPGPDRNSNTGIRQYTYTYDVYRSPRAALSGNGGQVTDSADNGNYFAVFDFFGHVTGSADASNLISLRGRDWSIIEATSTASYVPAARLPGDKPNVRDVVFGYKVSNASLSVSRTGLYLGQVSLRTTNPVAAEAVSSYSAATQRASNTSLNADNTSLYLGPAVPEPTSIALCTLGLLGLVGYRRWPARGGNRQAGRRRGSFPAHEARSDALGG
jgi:hypothetical protein